MGPKGWNVAVLFSIGAIWICGTTQHEKQVVTDVHRGRVAAVEDKVALGASDADAVRELAQAYLDAHQPGMALAAIERSPASVRSEPTLEHLYARALLDQGRSADALEAEKRVLATCTEAGGTGGAGGGAASPKRPSCSSWLIASATRRVEIVEQLVELGIEDANAHPEASSLAYHNATRQVSLSVSSH